MNKKKEPKFILILVIGQKKCTHSKVHLIELEGAQVQKTTKNYLRNEKFNCGGGIICIKMVEVGGS